MMYNYLEMTNPAPAESKIWRAFVYKKRLLAICALLTALSCLTANFASAQQDPNDPGSADTLYFEAGGARSENGDTLFIPSDTSAGDVLIYIKMWNDNPVQAIAVPLIDTCGVAFLDSFKNNGAPTPACFLGTRMQGFGTLTLNLDLNPPKVMYGAVSFGSPLGPGSGLFATMIYSIPPRMTPTCICLDSCFFPPSGGLSFVRTDAIAYVPVLKKRCFQVAAVEVTDVDDPSSQKGCEFNLSQNYPNPFNSLTTIPFTVERGADVPDGLVHVTVSIYDILGRKVRSLLNQKKPAGEYLVSWDGKDDSGEEVASGVYLYKLVSGGSHITKKMILIK